MTHFNIEQPIQYILFDRKPHTYTFKDVQPSAHTVQVDRPPIFYSGPHPVDYMPAQVEETLTLEVGENFYNKVRLSDRFEIVNDNNLFECLMLSSSSNITVIDGVETVTSRRIDTIITHMPDAKFGLYSRTKNMFYIDDSVEFIEKIEDIF